MGEIEFKDHVDGVIRSLAQGDRWRVDLGWWCRVHLDVSADQWTEREAELAQQIITAALEVTEVEVHRMDVPPHIMEFRAMADPLEGGTSGPLVVVEQEIR